MLARTLKLTVGLSLVLAGSAHAAVTIGNDVTQQPDSAFQQPCTDQRCLYVTTAPPATASANGVITSWSEHAGLGHPGTPGLPVGMRLVVLRPAAGNYTVVGASNRVTVTTVGVQTFPTNVRIAKGDFIALELGDPSGPNLMNGPTMSSPPSGSAVTSRFNPAPDTGLGSTFSQTPTATDPNNLLVSAKVEPDADGDGFGDETQDACLGDAHDHVAPCGAVTLGRAMFPVDPLHSTGAGCGTQPCLWTQTDLMAPSAGVITRYRIITSSPSVPPGVRALTPAPGFGSGVSGPLSPAPGGAMTASDTFVGDSTGTFDARAPVAAGDLIGWQGGPQMLIDNTAATSAVRQASGVATAPGTIALGAPTTGAITGSVDIEPDADRDGYGDSTQDTCAQDPATHTGPCTADVAMSVGQLILPTVLTPGIDTVAAQVANHGPTDANHVVVTLTPSAGVTLVSPFSANGTCVTTTIITCTIAVLHKAQTANITASALASAAGTYPIAVHGSSDTIDPDPSNNDVGLTAAISFPFQIQNNPDDRPCHTVTKGTLDPNRITGTAFGDKITAGGGRDIVHGGLGDDCIYGGLGDDVLYGDAGNDKLYGQDGNDRVFGGDGNDTLSGSNGKDYLSGGNGNDTITGSAGKDTILGGPGNDTINARDHGRDIVDCGPGSDTATVDRKDSVKHCEHVHRR
jgi:Ca2+-binding RTX toxin-like protein